MLGLDVSVPFTSPPLRSRFPLNRTWLHFEFGLTLPFCSNYLHVVRQVDECWDPLLMSGSFSDL